MPWRETEVMDERTILISEYLSGQFSLTELAERRGISRKSAYKWIRRYERQGPEGLHNLSRAAHHHPNAISAEVKEAILAWKARRPSWGAPKIHSKLQERLDCPAESTISNVLKREGLTRKTRRRYGATPTPGPLAAANAANDVWCADFKGWFYLGNGRRCDPLTISDAYSRYLLCCRGLGSPGRVETVKPWFEEAFREYGLPRVIRTDNGPPFASSGIGGLSALSVWWVRLGIRVERIEPGHPEQNGRHERLHRTLKEATMKPVQKTLKLQQAAFAAFHEDYNNERPHEALGQRPPATVYQRSQRMYCSRLLPPQYSSLWQARTVRSNGEIRWAGEKIFLGEALIGQTVGLEPVADGLWAIHFMDVELGVLDERHQRVLRQRYQRTKTPPQKA